MENKNKMTFKKGYFKEKDGFYFQVSYGLERWVLIICKVEDAHDSKKYLIEQNFKLKREAKQKFNYYLENINLLRK